MSTQAVANLQTEVNRLKHELATMKVDDQIPSAGATVTVADYLLERLVQLKVTVRRYRYQITSFLVADARIEYIRCARRFQPRYAAWCFRHKHMLISAQASWTT